MSDSELGRKRIERRLARLEADWREYQAHDETEQDFESRIARRRSFARDLLERFPAQFYVRRGGEDFFLSSPSIGSGWMPVFVRLVESLQRELDREPELGARFSWSQVKEKFGGLRCYWQIAGRGRRVVADVHTGHGVTRIEPEPRDDLERRITELVHAAEAEAARTCETCGAQPAFRYRFGWWTTLCREHFGEQKVADREARTEAIPRRREDLELLRAHIRKIVAERHDVLAMFEDGESQEPLTTAALRQIVPIINRGGCKYVRLADIPQPARDEFGEALRGSTVPGIPGEDPDAVAYAHDWLGWLEGYTPGWGKQP